jgi:serine phosphatase RsbU (regulator of sigma subunit)
MPSKIHAIDVWQEMSVRTLVRLALAAFLLFSALGLVSVLIESSIRVFSWPFVIVQAVAAGGMAATIVLFGRRRWWMTMLLVIFWNGVMVFNGGGISFVFSSHGGLRVRLGGPVQVEAPPASPNGVVLTAAELDGVYVQRGLIGAAVIVLLVTGYVGFISVIRREIRRRSSLEAEVRIAQGIQQSLLPKEPFESATCSIYGATLPAGEVGGDYYDIIPLPDGRVALAIADVTGHGVGAGILSAMTKSALRLQLGHEPDPRSVLNHLNKVVFDVSDEKTFVTFAYALITPADRAIHLATAGHPPFLHRAASSGVVRPLRSRSVALGMRADSSYADVLTQSYQEGDLLLLYTDGVLEVSKGSGEQYADRLADFLAGAKGTPQEIVTGLLGELRRYGGNRTSFDDDVSLVCVRFKGGSTL